MPSAHRSALLLVAVTAALVAGCPRGDAPSTDDVERAEQPSSEPVVITLGPEIELRDHSVVIGPPDAVSGKVRRLPEGRWSLQWRDHGGTILHREITGGADREFTIVVAGARSIENEIVLCKRARDVQPVARATFYVELAPATRTGYVRIATPRAKDSLDDAFPAEAVSWRPARDENPPATRGRRLAVDLELESLGDRVPFEQWRKDAATGSPTTRSRERSPCLCDSAFTGEVQEHIRKALSSPAARVASIVSLGDGLSPTYRGVPYDFCTSAGCMREFRGFVERRYGTLEALSKAWGRDVASWDDIVPVSLEESGFPMATDYAPWLDHLAFRESIFARFLRMAVGTVRKSAPRAAVGYWGASSATVYGAADAAEVNALLNWRGRTAGGPAPYFNELTTHRMAGSLRLGAPGGADGADAFASVAGGDLVQRFGANEVDAARACDVFAGGLGRLLQMAGPLPPRRIAKDAPVRAEVALVHSRASVAASFLVDARASNLPWQRSRAGTIRQLGEEDSSWRQVWRAWCRLLRDCGVPYRVLSSRDVAGGELTSKGYRVAVLVRGLAVADDEAAELERFARAGGVVVTDAGAGLYDGHVRLHQPGVLASLFGIARTEARFSEVGSRRVKIAYERFKPERPAPGRDWFPRVASLGIGPAERGFVLRGARCEGHFGDVPCLAVNAFGGGWGVTLNLALSGYLDVRPLPGGGRDVRRLMDGLLRRARVRPVVKMRIDDEAPVRPEIELRSFESALIAVVRRDAHADVEPIRARFLIEAGGGGALYDAVRGEFLGRTSEIDVELEGGQTRIYTLLPYRLLSLGATPAGSVSHGERVGPERVEIALRRDGNTPWCTHVVQLAVTGPDGRRRADLGRLVEIAGGRATVVIPFGVGDPQGLWTIRLRDAATGVVSVARLTRWER